MMSQFTIINESTEDTVGTADDIHSAIHQAKDAAQHSQAGDLVTVLEVGGMAVRQFVLLANGTVAELALARQVKHIGR